MAAASTAKHVGLYVLFTAIPIVVVIIAWRLGRDLRPHVSIAGPWRADVEMQLSTARACRSGWGRDITTLDITQIGSRVELDFTEARLRLVGVFAGGSFEAHSLHEAVPVTFTGRMDGTEDHRVVFGTLRFACAYPLSVRVRAWKEP
jgi:hypothetical protein